MDFRLKALNNAYLTQDQDFFQVIFYDIKYFSYTAS